MNGSCAAQQLGLVSSWSACDPSTALGCTTLARNIFLSTPVLIGMGYNEKSDLLKVSVMPFNLKILAIILEGFCSPEVIVFMA